MSHYVKHNCVLLHTTMKNETQTIATTVHSFTSILYIINFHFIASNKVSQLNLFFVSHFQSNYYK